MGPVLRSPVQVSTSFELWQWASAGVSAVAESSATASGKPMPEAALPAERERGRRAKNGMTEPLI
jgi:hypothetical protein